MPDSQGDVGWHLQVMERLGEIPHSQCSTAFSQGAPGKSYPRTALNRGCSQGEVSCAAAGGISQTEGAPRGEAPYSQCNTACPKPQARCSSGRGVPGPALEVGPGPFRYARERRALTCYTADGWESLTAAPPGGWGSSCSRPR